MRSVGRPYRHAIFSAINGHLSYNGVNVPVYDEFKSPQDPSQVYVCFSTEQAQPILNQDAFIIQATVDIEIYAQSGGEVSKDVLDDVEDQMLQILFPDPHTFGVSIDPQFSFNEVRVSSEITVTASISPTSAILRKIIKISSIITQ